MTGTYVNVMRLVKRSTIIYGSNCEEMLLQTLNCSSFWVKPSADDPHAVLWKLKDG